MGRKTTIKARVLRLSLISIFVLSVALVALFSILIYKAYDDSYQRQAWSLVGSYSQLIQSNIENLQSDLDTAASDLMVFNEAVPANSRISRLTVAAETSHFKDFSIARSDGTTLNDTDISDREYFQNAMKGQYYVSSPVVRKTDNSITTMVAAPAVTYNGKQYVVYGGLDSLYFSRGLDSIDMGAGSTVSVIDKYGQIVASSTPAQVAALANYTEVQDAALQDFANAMLANEKGVAHYQYGGIDFMAVYQKIDGTDGWTIAVSANYSEIVRTIIFDIVLCLILCALLILIGITVSIKVSNNISRPLNASTTRLLLLAGGDVKTPFENNAPNDETRVLSQSLVDTVQTLRLYIEDIDHVLGALAAGDLTVRSTIEYKGDFQEIGASLREISSALNNAFSTVKDNMASIQSGATQVAVGAQTLSSTAVESSQAVSDISSTVARINEQADNTAAIARKAADLTHETNKNAHSGGDLMKELLIAVENIKDKSSAISQIMKTIGDIAFQTNILALNASIEAARAGAAGKGFAVVANEVGVLATRSQEAAQNTETLITDSLSAVDVGMQLAKRVYEQMQAIVNDIGQVTSEIERIDSAANDQKESLDLITENMSKIETGMQSNTATAAESAASSEELSSLSTTLVQTVSKYKTSV